MHLPDPLHRQQTVIPITYNQQILGKGEYKLVNLSHLITP